MVDVHNLNSLASVGVVNQSKWPSFTIFACDYLFNKRVRTYLTHNLVIWIYQLFKLDAYVGLHF